MRDAEDDDCDASEQLPMHGCPRVSACKPFRLQARAFMLTFNSLLFAASPQEFVAFQAWVEDRKERFKATHWSATLETSQHAREAGRAHMHCYFSWHGTHRIDHRTLDAWCYKGVRPRVDVNRENRGPSYWLKAVQHGHFYVLVHKIGTLFSAGNYQPWQGIWVPEAQWVVSLWRQEKLDHAQYFKLSTRLKDGHDRRKANFDCVLASENALAQESEKAQARELVRSMQKPFKNFPEKVLEWMRSHEAVSDRYDLLVLYGRSRTGKTRWARNMCSQMFSEDATLVIDCQHAEHPNLRAYKRSKHKAIIMDEISGPDFVVGNKKLLQAHMDGAELGQSPTQHFAYDVLVWRTPIIVTTNHWDYTSLCNADVDWLEANCVTVHVDEPVWLSDATPLPDDVPAPRFSLRAAPATPRRTRLAVDPPGPSPEHTRMRLSS